MSNVAKLKKQAAEFELKRQFDKALAVYVKLLDSFDEHASELDVALFNRVGDLMLRQGNVADAVDYYEKAVDRYADTGFFNNAIALCNKILRHSPGRASVYYKLGKISAQKGFKNDAKVNFLEYADRMQKVGNVNEAFRALKEFADLTPDNEEIRLMLADQLTKADRKDEAIEQLQILHERYDADGRSEDAAATAAHMRVIDPNVEPRLSRGHRSRDRSDDLIFLDLDAPSPGPTPISSPVVPPAPRRTTPPAPRPAYTPPPAPAPEPIHGAPIVDRSTPSTVDSPLEITRLDDDAIHIERTPTESIRGLQSTRLDEGDDFRSTPTDSMRDLEPTSLVEPEPQVERERTTPGQTPAIEAHVDAEDSVVDADGNDLEFIVPDSEASGTKTPASIDFDSDALTTPAAQAPTRVRPSRPTPAALEGLPLMELEVPETETPVSVPRVSAPVHLPSVDELDLIDASHATTESAEIESDQVGVPTPSIARQSTMVAAHSVELLKKAVDEDRSNWGLRRELAEAMLDAGDREGGIRELESTMVSVEKTGDLDLASSLAEEVARLEPDVVKHHQKRVEYAFRTNDRARLIEAYLALADALLRADQADKARTVYQRVLDLAPDEMRAKGALAAIVAPEPPARSGASGPRKPGARPSQPVVAATSSSDSFVNLGDLLRDEQAPRDTRMVVAEQEPTGDEEADFADMLRRFKQGLAENVAPEDYQSHYDLAIAFKEMGLLDEAIAEFQKALGSPTNRVATYEALGQCFIEKGQFKLASSILARALNERAPEEQLVGVLYLLGQAAEAQGNPQEALAYYQRVFVLDIQFRDITQRLSDVERAAR